MKTERKTHGEGVHPFWGSSFIKGIPKEIERINESLGLELEYTVNQPKFIDGDPIKAGRLVFMIKKRPWFLNETYCLYSLYEDGYLDGFIGKLKGDEIRTIKGLGRIKDLQKEALLFQRWLQGLIKASCDKI